MMRSNASSGDGLPSRSSTFAGGAMPAQLTTTRRGPDAAAVCTASATCSGLVTSAAAKVPPSSAATSEPAEVGRSMIVTAAPAAARRRAVASPSPLAPPVTRAEAPVMSMCSPSNVPQCVAGGIAFQHTWHRVSPCRRLRARARPCSRRRRRTQATRAVAPRRPDRRGYVGRTPLRAAEDPARQDECMELRLKRVYDDPTPDDGFRVLVDRLWPRGLTKERAAIGRWAKDAAPSAELRKAWHAAPAGCLGLLRGGLPGRTGRAVARRRRRSCGSRVAGARRRDAPLRGARSAAHARPGAARRARPLSEAHVDPR